MLIPVDSSRPVPSANRGAKPEISPDISIIIPIYNEEESVDALVKVLWDVLEQAQFTFEVLFINDGSWDRTLARLRAALAGKPHARVIDFRRNYGQTAAIMAGIDYATGGI